MTPRAPAMSRDERRAVLVEVALPLLREHGAALTTKQVADAAGIAEGTLFRAFATKDDLVHACAAAVFDNTETLAALADVDRDQPLDARLADGVAVMQGHLHQIIGLIGTLAQSGAFGHHGSGQHGSGRHGSGHHDPRHHDPGHHSGEDDRPEGPRRARRMSDPEVDAAFVELIGEDARDLRLPAEDVVGILAHLTLSSSHPMFPVRSMTPSEIVSVVLDGTRKAR
ncbi:TetR/AcrR family transcriptional regulator [Phycicoccus sp. CSK15P-2]|uniref:TetR/AcrR family transcriptional regulator n=1 Tax=Phycicoccus sp. CSK15P-2 TaxID=2807627 RepID=UPI00194E94ED|nr:TetR/AcrR family transcriptional regulator [Phycicoccus sp. CSK15P-2]MBM6404598.1 TetR/AcrR family transcriptional regulator [Phycicoccus sp. CSK15P-2]